MPRMCFFTAVEHSCEFRCEAKEVHTPCKGYSSSFAGRQKPDTKMRRCSSSKRQQLRGASEIGNQTRIHKGGRGSPCTIWIRSDGAKSSAVTLLARTTANLSQHTVESDNEESDKRETVFVKVQLQRAPHSPYQGCDSRHCYEVTATDATAKGEEQDAGLLFTIMVGEVRIIVQNPTLVQNFVSLDLKDIVCLLDEAQEKHLLVQIDGRVQERSVCW